MSYHGEILLIVSFLGTLFKVGHPNGEVERFGLVDRWCLLLHLLYVELDLMERSMSDTRVG